MPNDPARYYDRKFTCPFARWHELAPNHLTYGMEGMEPCAAVTSDGDKGEKPFAWSYHVKCPIHGRIFSSRKDTRAACLQEAFFWLQEDINCPGHIRPQLLSNGT
jgi:hypothetical protein